MSDPYFISRTTGDWLKGGFRFGFNISRVFTVVSPDKFKEQYLLRPLRAVEVRISLAQAQSETGL